MQLYKLSLFIMTGLQFASLFCVLLIQRVAGQFGQLQCQPDISLSYDDLLRAIGQGNCNQQTIALQNSCNTPSIPISIQQPCGCQPSLSISNSCGCGPSLSIASQPISISNQRSCGCGIQQPSFTIPNQQSFQQSPCGCGIQQPSFTINQNACGCGEQPSFAIGQPISISNQRSCGCQPSISQPISVNQQCGSGSQQLQSALSLLSQQCGNQLNNQPCNVQIACNPCDDSNLVIQNQCLDVANLGSRIAILGNAGGSVANVVPAALLQAPPFGIYFAGDNLIIDGAVQVCGSMPFTSAVEISGRVPASGSGCVQYECNDLCS